ncbi:MAG: pyruvate kinase [Planctomycetia bacterium 21-64-5]|nr:MAG: pyruvate kinase [Planctomycetia bacterium 21-64-5]HQU42477.1 pyruvate kinase [Pirellulales bacterium]
MVDTPSTPTFARTKVIATIGPACREESQLAELARAGVDVFRLNMAHGGIEKQQANLEAVRRVSQAAGRPIGVLTDLAGPKLRLGELPGGQVECCQDAHLRFVRGDVSSQADELVSTYARLIDEVKVGDRVMLADGTVSLQVEERGPDVAVCRVVQSGMVRSRQGINLPGVKLGLPAMNEEDCAHAIWAAQHGVDFVGLSFIRSPDDVLALKALLRAHSSRAMVIAKIEKPEALVRLEEIVAAADGVMVARGDLGVEIDVARMPVAQKQIVAVCNRHRKPVIIATQMLDSMQHSQHPTRAEVTDVANAILDGCDACMLSGETAVGQYPRAAVEMMNRIALATEPLLRGRAAQPISDVRIEDLHRVTEAVVYGVQFIASQLDAKLIVVVTHSGATALALSKLRTHVPIVAVSDLPTVSRQMCLYWGVTPLENVPTNDSDQLIKHIETWGRTTGMLSPGDHIVVVSGIGLVASGHNMLVVHEVTPG